MVARGRFSGDVLVTVCYWCGSCGVAAVAVLLCSFRESLAAVMFPCWRFSGGVVALMVLRWWQRCCGGVLFTVFWSWSCGCRMLWKYSVSWRRLCRGGILAVKFCGRCCGGGVLASALAAMFYSSGVVALVYSWVAFYGFLTMEF